MRAATLIFSILIFGFAKAEISQLINTERTIEQRVAELVHQVDPDAQVFVKLKIKEVKLDLPGVSYNYFGVTAINTIDLSDVEGIDINILSVLDPFPSWVKQKIEQNFKFPQVRTTVKIQNFQPEELVQIYDRRPAERILNWVGKNLDGLLKYSFWAVALTVSVILTAMFGILMTLPNFWRSQITRLISAIDSGNESSQESVSSQETKLVEEDLKPESFHLPLSGIIELLADCYWTKEDGYARWFWDHLLPDKKSETIKTWDKMNSYAKHLQSCKPTPESFHLDPYYLNPHALKDCDMEDLQKFVLSNKSFYSNLSPIRKNYIDIPLNTKLEIVSIKSSAQVKLPSWSSSSREFDALSDMGELSLQDEQLLWDDENLVPDKLKSKVRSLVWLAKLELGDQQEIISSKTAMDLARAWVGPEIVLEKIKQAIPEKKLKLMESYLKNVSPTRKSESFKQLCKESADRYLNKKVLSTEMTDETRKTG